jgi:multidrug efflux system outer membrane protein
MKFTLPRLIIGTVASLLIATGCSVGPNYHPPKPAMPAGWNNAPREITTNNPVELAAWWKTFNDVMLDSLIERAAQANNDLKAAEARVRAARALRGVAVADLLPTIGANASLITARRSQNALSFPVRLLDTDTYQVGFDATWEIDVFGGERRALQAATADLQSVIEDQRNVLVSLLAEVARNYVEVRGTQRQLAIARENLTAQQETLDITQLRLDKGLASELDVAQAKAVLASTKSQLPSLETALKQSSHRLSVLLGEQPGSLDVELASDTPIPTPAPEVPAGLPSDLLLRRPDVRRGERQLAAATARIGEAAAELFPKFFLTGVGGYQSLDASNLIEPASKFWSAGPSVRWRLLEYPRLKAQVNAQTAVQEETLAQFNQTVLLSLEEVENALVGCGKERERYQLLSELLAASRQALDLANQLYTKGLGDFLNVLIAERAVFEAQDAQVQSERMITEHVIALYKALGGGWDSEVKTD